MLDLGSRIAGQSIAAALIVALLPGTAQASPPASEPERAREFDAVVEIEANEAPGAETIETPSEAPIEGPQPAEQPQVPAPTLPSTELVRVAVGFSPEVLGDKQEKLLLDRLEASARSSSQPPTEVRRLRVGAAEARVICREGRDDLVVTIGYLPERSDPVLLSFDCRLDRELGVRGSAAVDEAGLVGVLWDEHRDLVAAGARERKRTAINPKLKTGLIAGAAVIVIGAAIGLLIAGAVQREVVTLTITPGPPP